MFTASELLGAGDRRRPLIESAGRTSFRGKGRILLMRRILITALATAAIALATATPAAAATQIVGPGPNGTFLGNDCTGGFSSCYATQTGVVQGAPTDPALLGSPVIIKSGSDGETDISSLFTTVTGGEFQITYTAATNILSFLYTPGAGDPDIHYFDIKQGDAYVLFYDANAITSGSIDLDNYFPNTPGFSHITFFDTGARGVPEPATWGLMLLGFGGIGMALRRSRRRAGALMQIA
jgi:hypothetical protein